MIDDRRSPWLRAALALLLAGSIAACGGDDITFGGGDDDDDDETETVTLTGNIDDVFPVSTRDIVVFAYNIDDGYSCPCPTNPADPLDPSYSTSGKAVVVESGETEFTITGLDTGPIGVVFLLDEAGDNADGEIDDGDLIAILDDIDCELDEDLEGNSTVTLKDVDIHFDAEPVLGGQLCTDDPPAVGRARADEIASERNSPGD